MYQKGKERKAIMKRIGRKLIAFSIIMAMVLTMGVVPSSAASKYAPKIEEIEYNGLGTVEVDFIGHVKYKKSVKVTVKDNKGKKYTAKILKRDNDDLKFKILNYKKGRTYTFKIKGIKKWSAKKYRTVTGKVKIKKASKFIGVAKAKNIALKNAGLTAKQVVFRKAKFEYDDGLYIYEIEFLKGGYEYEYEIHAKTGRILAKDVDYDD